MKKLALLFLPLLLIGAGCAGSSNQENNANWDLSFDLPEGWVEVTPYRDGEVINLRKEVSTESSNILLQSTSKTIVRGGALVGEAESLPKEELETESYTQIEVERLSTRRAIPEGEDLGNGFTKVQVCGENEDCRIYGAAMYEYYLTGTDVNYHFTVGQREQDLSKAESVILSAKKTK